MKIFVSEQEENGIIRIISRKPVTCCDEMHEDMDNFKIQVLRKDLHAKLVALFHGAFSPKESVIHFCPWCGKRIEYVLVKPDELEKDANGAYCPNCGKWRGRNFLCFFCDDEYTEEKEEIV